jgi:hypothetical protein
MDAVFEQEDFQTLSQVVSHADVVVRGKIVGIGAGRELTGETGRAFLVDITDLIHGSHRDAQLVFEDGSVVLDDGRSIGLEHSPWLTLGDEVFLFLEKNDAIDDKGGPAYESQHSYSVVLIEPDKELANPPRLANGTKIASDLAEFVGLLEIAREEISDGAVPDFDSADERAEREQKLTGDPVAVATARGSNKANWDLVLAPTSVGFCWAVVPPRVSPDSSEWSCPTFELVETLLQSGPIVLPANPDSGLTVGIALAADLKEVPNIAEVGIDDGIFGDERSGYDLRFFFGIETAS